MLHSVMSASARRRRRVLRLCVVVLALVCTTMVSALVAPTKAEAKRLNVKLEITNLDEHPEIKGRTFHYVCSFFRWNDWVTSGWRLSESTGQWKWSDYKNENVPGKEWVAGPNDLPNGYWHNLDLQPGQTQSVDAGGDTSCFYFYPVISPFAPRTDPALSLVDLQPAGNTWWISYNDRGYGPRTITPFNFGGFPSNNDGTIILRMRYTPGLPKPPAPKFNLALKNQKQIDWLGDNQPNSDTTYKGINDYRLYLTSKTVDNTDYGTEKKKNIIFAIDISQSMRYEFNGVDKGLDTRWNSVKSAVDRLINGLGDDPNNRFSIVTFSSDDWYSARYHGEGTHIRDYYGTRLMTAAQARGVAAGLTHAQSGGTDYSSAFRRIDECCQDTNEWENIVLFITDGEPTSVPKDELRNLMGATAQAVIATAYTREAAKEHLGQVKSFFSIFVGTNQGTAAVLSMITQATNIAPNEKGSVQASNDKDMQDLINLLTRRIKKPDIGVAIKDQLSQYVDFYPGSQKVVATEMGGSPRTLSLSEYSFEYDGVTKTVTAKINKPATKDTTYVLSFDVHSNQTALDEWRSSGYPDTGDLETDYADNKSSSGKEGFFSNAKAVGQITFDLGAGEQSVDYPFPKPVVQVFDNNNKGGIIKGHVTLFNQQLDAGKFSFGLYDCYDSADHNIKERHKFIDAGGLPVDVKNQSTDKDNGWFSFPTINYKEEGTYWYKIKQESMPGDLDGDQISASTKIKYDTHEALVKVIVTKEDGSFVARVEYDPKDYPDDASEEDKAAYFYNTYGVQGTYQ